MRDVSVRRPEYGEPEGTEAAPTWLAGDKDADNTASRGR